MAIEKTPIGIRLAKYRKLCGFKNAAELAEAVDSPAVTRSTIVNVELGRKRDLTVTELMLISRTLGISPMSLMIDMEDIFAKETDYEGFEDVIRVQLISWIGGKSPTFIPESMPGVRDSSIVEHLENALRYSGEAYELRQEAEQYETAEDVLALELGEKVARRAALYSERASKELESIEQLTGKVTPESALEALLLEGGDNG